MRLPLRSLCVALILLIVPATAGRSDAAPERPIVGVYSLDALPQSGHLVGLDAEGLRLQGEGQDEAKTFPLDSLREVRFPNGTRIPPVAHHQLTLIGGEVLVGHVRAPTDEGLELEVAHVGRIQVRYEEVRTLVAVPAGAGTSFDAADKSPPAEGGLDILYLTSDDEYRGTLEGADETHIRIEKTTQSGSTRVRKIPWDKLHVLHLSNELPPPATGVQTELELIDGSRLHTGSTPTLTDEGIQFTLRSVPDKKWVAPLSRIRVMRMKGGRFEYASELKFTSKRTSYYPPMPNDPLGPEFPDRWWGLRKNRRQDGGPLQINGNVYRYGFALHGKTEITLELDGKFKSFRSGFGIDDEVLTKGAPELASVDVRIYKDDSETAVFERQDIKHGQLVAVGPIDVTGVKRLKLVVDWGKHRGTCDHSNWVDPVVVRK